MSNGRKIIAKYWKPHTTTAMTGQRILTMIVTGTTTGMMIGTIINY